MAQLKYDYITAKGIAGTFYDITEHAVDSRTIAGDGVKYGLGVVVGDNAGLDIKLPTADSTIAEFEGIVVNGLTHQQEVNGGVTLRAGDTVGVIKNGRGWVRVATGVTIKYGDTLKLVTSGDEAGYFTNGDGLAVTGYFLGEADDGIAPVYITVDKGAGTSGGDTGDTGNTGNDEP